LSHAKGYPKEYHTTTNRVPDRRSDVPPNPTAFVLPVGLLQQDADIIDDQENHIVLTLRLPKEVIRSNRALLRALAEMAAQPEKGDLADA
jgi:hypothetical protein